MNCHGLPATAETEKSKKISLPYPRLHPVADFIFFLENTLYAIRFSKPTSGKFAKLIYAPSVSIVLMHFKALTLTSSSNVISSPPVPLTQLYTSISVVSFILWHTQSFERG